MSGLRHRGGTEGGTDRDREHGNGVMLGAGSRWQRTGPGTPFRPFPGQGRPCLAGTRGPSQPSPAGAEVVAVPLGPGWNGDARRPGGRAGSASTGQICKEPFLKHRVKSSL